MSTVIGITTEKQAGECRVAIIPAVAKKFHALGAEILLQKGAGELSCFTDDMFDTVKLVDSAEEIYRSSDVVLCIQPPQLSDLEFMKPNSILLGLLKPWSDVNYIQKLVQQKITAFPLELLPRITRSQSMDVLSSQGTVSGYVAALIAVNHTPKFFPMITYAAGTIRPSRVLVIGAGVAGLQAIATARRLGAIIEAYDVRPETKEQIESLGAKYVDTGVNAVGEGGYARALTEEEKQIQAERLTKALSQSDVVITTAAVPGKPAPRIITESMLSSMKSGSIIVDMAAEMGGNVEGCIPDQIIKLAKTTLICPTNIPSRLAIHASEMYASNLYNFLLPVLKEKEGSINLDFEDEVIKGTCLTHDGQIMQASIKKFYGLGDE